MRNPHSLLKIGTITLALAGCGKGHEEIAQSSGDTRESIHSTLDPITPGTPAKISVRTVEMKSDELDKLREQYDTGEQVEGPDALFTILANADWLEEDGHNPQLSIYYAAPSLRVTRGDDKFALVKVDHYRPHENMSFVYAGSEYFFPSNLYFNADLLRGVTKAGIQELADKHTTKNGYSGLQSELFPRGETKAQ